MYRLAGCRTQLVARAGVNPVPKEQATFLEPPSHRRDLQLEDLKVEQRGLRANKTLAAKILAR